MDKAVEMLQLRVSGSINQLIDTHSEFEPMYFYLFPIYLLFFPIFFILFYFSVVLSNVVRGTKQGFMFALKYQ